MKNYRQIIVLFQHKHLILSLVLFFLCAEFIIAQNFWQPTKGPYGGSVVGFGKDSSGRLYCGTANGVFRSSDNGNRWEFCSPTLPNQRIVHFTVVPNEVLFAVVNNGDLYRSTDLGNTWTSSLILGSNNYINDIDYDLSAGVVYIVLYPLSGSSVCYCSFDQGASWQTTSNGITSNQAYAVAVNKKNGYVYINSFAGVFRSTNKGNSWKQMNNGITNAGMFGYAIAVNDAGTVFAGFSSGSNYGGPVPGGIYISFNDGTSWTQSNGGIGNPDVHFLECSPHDEIYAVNGQENGLLYRSTNRGATWTLTSIGWIMSDVAGMYFDGLDTFIGTTIGVERSTDAGASWSLTNDGLLNTYVSDLASNGNQSMYASTISSGMYRTTNAGGNWTQVLTGFDRPSIQSVVRTQKGSLVSAELRNTIYKSIDDGMTWVKKDSGKTTTLGNNYTMAMNDSDHVFLGFLGLINIQGKFRALNMIYRSIDDGESWRICHDTLANIWAWSIQFADEKTILAGGPAGLWRSLDDGWSWNKLPNQKGAEQIATLHYDRATQRLYSGTFTGLFFSTDRGNSFLPIDTTVVSQTWVITSNCDVLIISSGPNDVRISTNAGKTWTPIQSGLNDKRITKFLWTSDGWLYATTSGGVYRTSQKISIPPSAPQLFAPHDTTSNLSMNVLLEWLSTCNASTYHLQVATDQSFTKIIFDSSGLTNTICAISNLKSFTQYFWRVQAFGNSLNGTWSAVWTFTTMLLPPSAPTLSYPSNNSTSVSTSINMRWNVVIEATSYHLQVATDSAFMNIVFDQNNILPTSQAVNGLANGVVHFWRVNSANAAGEGDWSVVWKFTTLFAKLTAPILKSPPDASINAPANPSLSWNKVNGAVSYRIQVSIDSLFRTTVVDSIGIKDTLFIATTAGTNTKHYWRVNTTNGTEISGWSSIWSFTTMLIPPSPPLLSAPMNYALIFSDTLFEWESIYGKTSYRLQISTDQNFNNIFVDTLLTFNSTLLRGLSSNTTYYWRVNVTTPSGTSGWSEVWSFKTLVMPPHKPVTLSPPDNAINVSLPSTLVWNASANATAYRVQVSLSFTFTTLIIDQSGIMATSFSPTGLLNNVKYYWRVNAENAGGTSPWSNIWNFTTTPQTSIRANNVAEEFYLGQNYPNPFREQTAINYRLSSRGHVHLDVFDIFGRTISVLVDEEKVAGEYTSTFSVGRYADVRYSKFDIHPGIYFYRLSVGKNIVTRKMIVMK